MTLIAERSDTQTSGPGEVTSDSPEPRVIRVRQLVTSALALVVVLALAWFLVEDPIAHVWYTARQHQRSAALTKPGVSAAIGQTLAVLQAPTIGLNVAVVEGDSGDLLRGGPGHAPASPLPGKTGNSVIFGHSDGWGAPFAHLAKLTQGDALAVQVRGSAQKLAYTVTAVTRTRFDSPLLRSTDDYRLTLVTGSGGRRPGEYVVVTAVSGTPGAFHPASRPVPNPASESVLFNRDVVLFLLRAAAAGLVVYFLRRRFRPGVVAALATPLVAAALLALMLNLDRLLSPLG